MLARQKPQGRSHKAKEAARLPRVEGQEGRKGLGKGGGMGMGEGHTASRPDFANLEKRESEYSCRTASV